MSGLNPVRRALEGHGVFLEEHMGSLFLSAIPDLWPTKVSKVPSSPFLVLGSLRLLTHLWSFFFLSQLELGHLVVAA